MTHPSLPYAAERALGPLLPHLRHGDTSDLFLNGAAGLWRNRGGGAEAVPGWSLDEAEVRALAVGLIAAGGRHLDERNPCQDVQLGDGVRVHAVLAPISARGTCVSVRIPRAGVRSLAELVALGLCDRGTQRFLEDAVAARRTLLISGGTGSGKTTLLAALLGLADPAQRIVTIEDVAELRIAHPHHVALEARQPNLEGAGEISLIRLIREALRMRPDRIALGEARGPELCLLLAALNTGHAGSAGTVHANALAEVPARLEALAGLAGMSPAHLARQARDAIQLVIHLERRGGEHRIAGLGALGLDEAGLLRVIPLEGTAP